MKNVLDVILVAIIFAGIIISIGIVDSNFWLSVGIFLFCAALGYIRAKIKTSRK